MQIFRAFTSYSQCREWYIYIHTQFIHTSFYLTLSCPCVKVKINSKLWSCLAKKSDSNFAYNFSYFNDLCVNLSCFIKFAKWIMNSRARILWRYFYMRLQKLLLLFLFYLANGSHCHILGFIIIGIQPL